MYNYVYNNVVDFNNAINSLWPQGVDTIANGNIPTGKDSLSNLPPETLTEIMTHLPLESVQALSLTNRKISPTTKPVIQFKTNLKTQTLLETFDSDSIYFKQNYEPEEQKNFKESVEKAITFQNGSNDRVQALRNAICSIYQDKVSLFSLLTPIYYGNDVLFKDKLLVEQLMRGLTYKYDRCILPCYGEIHNEIVFLNLLKTNQIHLKYLSIRINVTSVLEELVEALIGALRENQSINKIYIDWADCNLIQLDSILKTIKNNERITKFEIIDSGTKRNCSGREWRWEKSAKENSYKEFEDLIKNKLSTTFQISQKDNYGFFPCERLPV